MSLSQTESFKDDNTGAVSGKSEMQTYNQPQTAHHHRSHLMLRGQIPV